MASSWQSILYHKAKVTLSCRGHSDRQDDSQPWSGEREVARAAHSHVWCLETGLETKKQSSSLWIPHATDHPSLQANDVFLNETHQMFMLLFLHQITGRLRSLRAGVVAGQQRLLICISTRQRQEYSAASEVINHSTLSLAIWLIRSHIIGCTNPFSDLVIASTLFGVFILSWNCEGLHDVAVIHFGTPFLFCSLVAMERKRFRILSPSCFLASLDGYSPNS